MPRLRQTVGGGAVFPQERIDEAIVCMQSVLRSARSQLTIYSAEQEIKAA